ncbi:glycosyltransferase [uncultured Clostridium sp.]|jgi:glycosyltransferase involved in cell wall biosynthesis|uniref:glycosyltransferase n=1 Tax=uncultured Clostridium sp. TaxID=59620 RepID=UPI0025E8A723|nr:glycosyltransferase [uncultured Clostridium sp.]
MKKKVGIIGQFPPPMHGLSKALDTLYNSYLNEEFDFTKIDITNNKKFLNNLLKIMFSKLDLYYLTISQSKFGNMRDLIMIKLIQLKRKKIVIHLHGGGFRNILDNEFGRFQKKINYKILSKVDAGIVLGDSLRYIFEGIIPQDKIYVVKNCVDDEFVISDKEFNEKLIALENKKEFKILYLSNFIEDKGYKEVLQLAKLVKEKSDERFKFIFAGKFFNESDEKQFFKFVEDNKLHSIIEYKGIASGNDKLNLLKDAEFFILLTRYKNEGQPISIIEASINGSFIVATNHAGINDILNKNEMIQVNKNHINIEEIYINIINTLNDKKVLKNKLVSNRRYIINNFSQSIYLNDLKNIYYKIFKG